MSKSASFDLSGRTVFITGASSGIGARFARVAAASGAKVVLGARRTDLTEALAAEIRAAGGQALAVPLDVADEASTIATYDAAEAAFGGVDSVIVNAGMMINANAVDLPVEDFDRVFEVNVRGAFLTAREGARRMIKAGSAERQHGRIILISSIMASVNGPGVVAYSASKAAVSKMGQCFAREWVRKGINVNTICPGYINTELTAEYFETDTGKKHINQWPRRRMLDLSDLDEMALYLASDASRAVTGASFTIDDGQSMFG